MSRRGHLALMTSVKSRGQIYHTKQVWMVGKKGKKSNPTLLLSDL